MKKLAMLVIVSLFVVGLSTRQAHAVAAFSKFFKKHYVEGSDNASLIEAYDAQKSKCSVCHYGKTKKNRNDYSKALSMFLKKADYKTKRVKLEPDLVDKELTEAFEKVEKMKSVGGETFGALIKAGKLPGTAPETDDVAEKAGE